MGVASTGGAGGVCCACGGRGGGGGGGGSTGQLDGMVQERRCPNVEVQHLMK